MNDIFQLAIIAFILLGIAVAVWRAGQANPEGTGRLARRLEHVEKVLERKATADDVADLKSSVAAMQAELEGDRRLNQLTFEAVKRLENYFLQRGTGAKE